MATTALELSRKYASFSGVDIRVVIAGETIGSLQAISYAVQREKAPVYVMGRVNPRSFSRGKRGIAGTMITLMFDQHVLFQEPFVSMMGVFDKDEMIARNGNLQQAGQTADLEEVVPGGTNFGVGDISDNYLIAPAWYVDQLPPFDSVIIAANEYGNAASMRIYGIEILNEGSGFSIDDMVIENQMTYVAIEILPWQKLGSWDFNTGSYTASSGTLTTP